MPPVFPQLLWEQTFLQSLWEQYTLTNLAPGGAGQLSQVSWEGKVRYLPAGWITPNKQGNKSFFYENVEK